MAKHGKGDNDGDDTDEDDAVPTTSSGSPSVPSSATSGSPTATATGSPIQLLQPANVTTCQDLTLRWQSSAAVPPLTLMVTNDRAVAGSLGGSAGDGILVSHTLASNISASATQYRWSPVDVPQGTYVVLALDTSGMLGQSPPFTVLAGQNASCINSAATGASSTSPPVPDSSSIGSSPASSSASASGSSRPSESPSKSLSPAALGGTVAGITVAIVLLLLAFTFPYYRRNSLTKRPRNSRPGGPYYLF
ncbi:hypothetical protein FKP32DRAFT_1762903 [Trametes sanguinea]|nr:hypothetical protein FKP32DRAFT_1762903 [Trametes sanguinea]